MALRTLSCALSVVSLMLVSSLSRAEYDWYNEEEGSRGDPDSHDDDDDYVAPYGGGPRAAEEGFGLGVRFAYAHPFGEIADDGDIDNFTRGVLKGQLDLEYGSSNTFALGLYLAVGGGFLPKAMKEDCEQFDADCSQLSIESGLSGNYRILPDGLIDPWVGANFGVEWLRTSIDSELGGATSVAFLGVAFGFTVGADVQLGQVAFGPYLSPQFGRFMRGKIKTEDVPLLEEFDESGEIDQRAFHYWLNIGLRARYQF
jgi:hypothetical protein